MKKGNTKYKINKENKFYCNCGCNEEMYYKEYWTWYGIPQHKKGHKNRGKVGWSKGLTKEIDGRVRRNSESKKNKTYEEIYGKEKAVIIINKISNSMKGKNIGARTKEVKLKIATTLKEWNRLNPVSDVERKIRSERMKGNQYASGYIHTEETKNKISIGNKKVIKTEEWNRKNSAALKGRLITQERIDKIKLSWKINGHPMQDKIHSNETKEKMSKTRCELILQNGGINPCLRYSKRGTFYSQKNQKEIRYESSYELQAYQILEQDERIKNYDRCKFPIDYTFNGGLHKYIPDIDVIYTDNTREILEIKPEQLLKDSVNMAKFIGAKEYCDKNNLTYSVWTEKNLERNI